MLRTRWRWGPTSGDQPQQLHPDAVSNLFLPPHETPIDGLRIHNHQRVSTMGFQTSTALSMVSVIIGVRIPTLFLFRRRRLLKRTGVGTCDLDWYHEYWWLVGYRDDLGEDREEEEQMLSSTGRTRRGWERHDLEGEFGVCDTIRVHEPRICHATNTSQNKKKDIKWAPREQ